jgi:ketosteroid isomerase-like protein
MSQENMQAARGLYDAFNRGDLDAFERGLSQDLLWNEAENSLNAADFDQFRCDLEQLIDGGEFVIGTGRYRGKSTATGKELSAQFCHLMHFDKNQKLDVVQEYADTLQEAEVTGKLQQAEQVQIPQPAY